MGNNQSFACSTKKTEEGSYESPSSLNAKEASQAQSGSLRIETPLLSLIIRISVFWIDNINSPQLLAWCISRDNIIRIVDIDTHCMEPKSRRGIVSSI